MLAGWHVVVDVSVFLVLLSSWSGSAGLPTSNDLGVDLLPPAGLGLGIDEIRRAMCAARAPADLLQSANRLQRAASQRPQRMTRETPYDALGGSAVSLTFIPGSSSHAFTRAVSISEE